jgi:hypothetical protein
MPTLLSIGYFLTLELRINVTAPFLVHTEILGKEIYF